jgi:hypothetical protein
MGRGTISFLTKLHHVLLDPCDHQLEAAFITELFASSRYSTISNPETLVAQASEHFEHFDDSDLKCRCSADAWCMKTDIDLQVDSTTLLEATTQNIVKSFLLPWTFVTMQYPWQFHLATQNSILKHQNTLHGFTGSLEIILQAKVMHKRHRGWPGCLEIYIMKHVHYA